MKLGPLLAATVLVAACSSETSSPNQPTAKTEPVDIAVVEVALVEVATLNAPLAITWRPGDDRAFIAEQSGGLVALSPNGTTTELANISDRIISGNEQGFLGLVFSPDGNWLYLSYTNSQGDSRLSVVPFDDTGPVLSQERILLAIDQPFANHNGGDIQFGPDGYLYWGLGDGGSGGDPEGNGQNPNSLLGAMLRIDPRPDEASYEIPADNPFAEAGGAPEVWLTGLRNPWRFSFDRDTGDLWIGDVGQGEIEEIDLVLAGDGGANLGWNSCEGNQSYEGSCDGFHAPVYTYDHSAGVSVTGGYRYRGTAFPQLLGAYIFADFATAELWGLEASTMQQFELGVGSEYITSFGEDPNGELWVLSLSGSVERLLPAVG